MILLFKIWSLFLNFLKTNFFMKYFLTTLYGTLFTISLLSASSSQESEDLEMVLYELENQIILLEHNLSKRNRVKTKPKKPANNQIELSSQPLLPTASTKQKAPLQDTNQEYHLNPKQRTVRMKGKNNTNNKENAPQDHYRQENSETISTEISHKPSHNQTSSTDQITAVPHVSPPSHGNFIILNQTLPDNNEHILPSAMYLNILRMIQNGKFNSASKLLETYRILPGASGEHAKQLEEHLNEQKRKWSI
jgi:hypothetical protein